MNSPYQSSLSQIKKPTFLFLDVFKIKKPLPGCFIEFSLEHYFKVINHDYGIRNIQQLYI